MGDSVLFICLRWMHLMATVAWIGGMFTNFFIYMPATRMVLETPSAGKLMGAIMKRFRILVYVSMCLFLLSGMVMGMLINAPGEVITRGESWGILLTIKIVIFTIMVILALYAFEVLVPKVGKLAAAGPSPELARLQKIQILLAVLGFVFGMIILAISAAL